MPSNSIVKISRCTDVKPFINLTLKNIKVTNQFTFVILLNNQHLPDLSGRDVLTKLNYDPVQKSILFSIWAVLDSNQRPSACKADVLTKLN